MPPLILQSRGGPLPPTPPGPMWPRGGTGERRTRPRSPTGFPPSDWAGEMLGALPPILQAPEGPSGVGAPPPSKPPLRGTGPLQPPHLLPSYSHVLPGCSGVPPVPLGTEAHHQCQAVALAVGRHILQVLPCRQIDSTPTNYSEAEYYIS